LRKQRHEEGAEGRVIVDSKEEKNEWIGTFDRISIAAGGTDTDSIAGVNINIIYNHILLTCSQTR
jgi:hypothetical protein